MTADKTSNPSDDGDGERVAKALARAGVASRREAERMIEAGRVALNGNVLTSPAVKVGPGDILTVDGAVVDEPQPARLWRYHKPPGLVTTHADPKGRPTVFENLPEALPRVISVGRLDLNSEGLLLLTNDGELARTLELPSSGHTRRYRARARGRIAQARLDRLKGGIVVDGVRYGAIHARLDETKDQSGANVWLTVDLAEGKNREVRKVLEAMGLTVNRLIRLTYGPFELGDLARGEAQEVPGPQLRAWLSGEAEALQATPSSPPRLARPKPAAAKSPGKAKSSEVARPAYKKGWARPKPRPAAAAKRRKARPKRTGPKGKG